MYPILFPNTPIAVPSYIAIISFAYCLGLVFVFYRAKKKGFNKNTTLDFALVLMISGFVGARVFHIIFEFPEYYLENLIRIFEIWKGGFVFYGGVILAFPATYYYAKHKKISYGDYLDLFTPVFALMYLIGRFSCLLAGCCYGSICFLPWAIVYPNGVEAPHSLPLHPTPIYAMIMEFIILCFILSIESSKRFSFLKIKKTGDLFALYMLLHAIARIIMEKFRGDYRGDEYLNMSISTWISYIVILVSLRFLLKRKRA